MTVSYNTIVIKENNVKKLLKCTDQVFVCSMSQQ